VEHYHKTSANPISILMSSLVLSTIVEVLP
jgi:hypothetical protein